ncbi:bifunctional histidinol-phosphatase/imidazoleglycerol-phosphate dehydratase HisB [Buchnera aphidicola (Kurisakia onigurumii)]|uniref:bifunctional histidinol-phosphatase/imidazoleglycerol-phosphate dehydratase HisB n=1 Tax=Buchnera aphidicola TaxID=9 RepID=UPI0031B6AA35
MLEKVLFLDRDGTLVQEPKDNFQIDDIKKICFEKDVISVLLELKSLGYIFVMITNQDGLGSDNFSFCNFYRSHNFIINLFRSQGIIFDDILICPHLETDLCECRKPNTKLVQSWLINNSLDKNNSYVIGDRYTDIELSHNMGIKGILYHRKNCSWKKIKEKILLKKKYFNFVRNTRETVICIKLFLCNKYFKKNNIKTGIGFFDHMLEQVSVHSGINFDIIVHKQDLYIDDHHTVEDVAIVLGQSLCKLLKNNKTGIKRYGFVLPMDESLCYCVIDVSGRSNLQFHAKFKYEKIGNLHTEMIYHFFKTLSENMNITIHLKARGKNDHHIAESLFKSFGQALKKSLEYSGTPMILSSKGIL